MYSILTTVPVAFYWARSDETGFAYGFDLGLR